MAKFLLRAEEEGDRIRLELRCDGVDQVTTENWNDCKPIDYLFHLIATAMREAGVDVPELTHDQTGSKEGEIKIPASGG
jgi:hypothetical protein